MTHSALLTSCVTRCTGDSPLTHLFSKSSVTFPHGPCAAPLRTNAPASPFLPQRSIVAGIRGANDMARCVLHSILHDVHATCFPRVISRSWVDDVVQRARGHAAQVLRDLLDAGALFAQGARAKHLTISTKTTCISTDDATPSLLAHGLRANADVPATAASTGPDLGVDRGRRGTTRYRPKGQKRWSAAQRRLSLIHI